MSCPGDVSGRLGGENRGHLRRKRQCRLQHGQSSSHEAQECLTRQGRRSQGVLRSRRSYGDDVSRYSRTTQSSKTHAATQKQRNTIVTIVRAWLETLMVPQMPMTRSDTIMIVPLTMYNGRRPTRSTTENETAMKTRRMSLHGASADSALASPPLE